MIGNDRKPALAVYCNKRIVGQDQCEPEYAEACKTAWQMMLPTQQEQLRQLVKSGPVWDGDVISKLYRDDLMDAGLATRVVHKGQQGYTGSNYYGWDVFHAGNPSGK